MTQLEVIVKRLNKRKYVPATLPDPTGIIGVVNNRFTFYGDQVLVVPNPAMGQWYVDRDKNYYWGGGLRVLQDGVEDPMEVAEEELALLEQGIRITPRKKRKIERVINVFETGTPDGRYDALVKLKDFTDPTTHELTIQVTYGRSQTTEFGHLRSLIEDYVDHEGELSHELQPYLQRIGKLPSLATDNPFCQALIRAGKEDPKMKECQDQLFDIKYFQPAFNWFTQNEFTHPLSMLVIYDSFIHSGSILKFLRKRFPEVVPASGGNEKTWIEQYVSTRDFWLANHSNPLLRSTIYRTQCFQTQITHANWDLSQSVLAHGKIIN